MRGRSADSHSRSAVPLALHGIHYSGCCAETRCQIVSSHVGRHHASTRKGQQSLNAGPTAAVSRDRGGQSVAVGNVLVRPGAASESAPEKWRQPEISTTEGRISAIRRPLIHAQRGGNDGGGGLCWPAPAHHLQCPRAQIRARMPARNLCWWDLRFYNSRQLPPDFHPALKNGSVIVAVTASDSLYIKFESS